MHLQNYHLLNKKIIYYLFLIIFIIAPFQKAIAQKNDTIVHVNGNILTGEFKKMIYGVVTWKMDGMGTISFEEPEINTIISKKHFEVKMKSGIIYFGSLAASKKNRSVYVLIEDKKILVDIDNIVEVYPIKKSFWMRLSGDFSLGANYSKGSKTTTLSFSGDLNYRKKKSYAELAWDENITVLADSVTSSKADLTLSYQRLLRKKWSAMASIGGNQNLELGTKLRLNLDLGMIKDISYNDWNRFYVGAGVNLTQETPYDDSGKKNDIAGLVQVVWKVYKYSSPKLWVDANIDFLPYFTDAGRYRTNFNLNPKISILSDNFKVGFKFYYNYDSKPSASAVSTNDYGINLQLTYSLH